MTPFRNCNLNGTASAPLQAGEGNKVVVPAAGYSYATVQIVPVPSGTGGATWSTAVVTVKRTNDLAATPQALESAVTVTSAAQMSPRIDVRGFGYLILELTTAEGSALKGDVYITTTGTGV